MKNTINKKDSKIKWNLLENGLDFLSESVTNLVNLNENNNISDNDKKRFLKYSVLHLISATEILFKVVLVEKNWEYIFDEKINQADYNKFANGNFQSITGETAIKRLSEFCNITLSNKEQNYIKKLKKYRNKMEHFKIEDTYMQILLTEFDVIAFLVKFIHDYILSNQTLDENENNLYNSIIQELQKLQDFIETREKHIKEENPNGYFIPCPKCGKSYYIHDKRKCLLCFYEADTDDTQLSDEYIYNILDLTHYSCVKDGGNYPIYGCPECEHESLVYDSQTNDLCFCYECGFKDEVYNYDFCSRCGTFMKKKNDIDICDFCIEDIWNKN